MLEGRAVQPLECREVRLTLSDGGGVVRDLADLRRVDCWSWSSSTEAASGSSVRGEQRRSNDMRTKKPLIDPDIEPEYDFRGSMPNPYAERLAASRIPRVYVVGAPDEHPGTQMVLEYDESLDAAYLTVNRAEWHHQVRLDDARGINYAADGSVIGIEILSPRRNGVLVDGLPYREDVIRVMRSVGFRVLEAAR